MYLPRFTLVIPFQLTTRVSEAVASP